MKKSQSAMLSPVEMCEESAVLTDRRASLRPEARGKFLFIGNEKLLIRGVTYGTFKPDERGNEFPDPQRVREDFSQMVRCNINAVRTYTCPPRWLLDLASQQGIFVMVGLPWESHIAFLESQQTVKSIEERMRRMIKGISGHPAILGYVIGNEIPGHIVRWHGPKKVERFLKRLYFLAKNEDPQGLVSYVNYPTTEYLQLPFVDFTSFNVYLEDRDRLESYLYHLHNIAGDRPLVMGEIGLDSRRNGVKKQAAVLDWQIRTAFGAGCAGAFVFAWTDEWHRGGHDIEDWDFGLTDRNRRPKPAMHSIQHAFSEVPFPKDMKWPRISVVICSYNGERTLRQCYDAIQRIDYPNFELIVVNDGSKDKTKEITRLYGFKMIDSPNVGLSAARNLGLKAATGDIVAYIDDDVYPDRDWLKFLAYSFLTTDYAGIGGPNIPPPEDGEIAHCVANAPGGPQHVLVSTRDAEHIPGCNMAFRKSCLDAVGGFDPRFRVAGDDVDLCWKMIERGWRLGFNPAAVVWHHRRDTIRTYLRQQTGYGRAEALLERKWSKKYNAFGHISWSGKLYGNGNGHRFSWKKYRIYHGTWGSAPFQPLYKPNATTLETLLLTPEWYIFNSMMMGIVLLGFFWKPLFMALPLLALMSGSSLVSILSTVSSLSFNGIEGGLFHRLKLRAVTGLLHILQPLARLWGRLSLGLNPLRMRCPPELTLPRSRSTVIWDENWKSPEDRLSTIEAALCSRSTAVRRGGDYDSWDLEVKGGVFGGLRMKMGIEEHGSGRQLVRLRSWPTIPLTGLFAATLPAFLAVAASMDNAWTAAAALGSIAAALFFLIFRNAAAATASYLHAIESLNWDRRVSPVSDSSRNAVKPATV
jgi:glycosyltransferase involved in cell wall biosynthesis